MLNFQKNEILPSVRFVMPNFVVMKNFVSTGLTVAEILQFVDLKMATVSHLRLVVCWLGSPAKCKLLC